MGVKVSVVVPIFNGEKYLDNCIKNLLNQTYDDLEFILVDDGSTDNTPKLLDDLAASDSRFIIIHKENGGPSSSRNEGMKRASGEYIIFYDVDDEMVPELISDNVKLAKDNDADVLMFPFWYHNLDNGKRWNNAACNDFVGDDREFFDKQLIDIVDREVFNAPWNKVFKRSFLEENNLKFLPEFTIYEDAVFVSMMLQHAKKIVVNDKPYYVYYVRSSGSLITKYVDCYFDAVTRLYEEARRYCSNYEDNSRQIRCFSEMYVRLVYTNLKQISCRENMPLRRKYELLRRICNNEDFRKALKKANLSVRRRVTRHFILTKNVFAISAMYRFLGRK